ncbi:MAG: hypothetical protein LBD43_03065 [Holosporales bacterium]|jgi:hypothetical protein|nr:hypothetical protein [Holosporales bacterium]
MIKGTIATCAIATLLLTITNATTAATRTKHRDDENLFPPGSCELHSVHDGHIYPLQAIPQCRRVKALENLRTCIKQVILSAEQYRECAQAIHATAEVVAVSKAKHNAAARLGSDPENIEREILDLGWLAAHIEWREGLVGTVRVYGEIHALMRNLTTLYIAVAFKNDEICNFEQPDDKEVVRNADEL